MLECFFFFQAEDGIRGLRMSRGLGEVYKRQARAPEIPPVRGPLARSGSGPERGNPGERCPLRDPRAGRARSRVCRWVACGSEGPRAATSRPCPEDGSLSDAPTATALPFRDEELADFLERTSRTFALAIPLLDEPLRREVGLGYLLLRVADTLEDAAPWTRDERRQALAAFASLLQETPGVDAEALSREWLSRRPSENAGYLDLLASTPTLLASLDALRPEAGAILRHFVLKTVQGMGQVLAGASENGLLQLESLQSLRDYCYIVAGLVGELLTDLFVLDPRLAPYAPNLRSLAPLFGEGLQLVNILKDARQDRREGRVWLPAGVQLQDVERLAGEDLIAAARYVRALHLAGAPRDVLAFTTLPLLLAQATLELLVRDGAGAKVSRAVVSAQLDTLQAALSRGTLPEAVEALAGPVPGGP
ncbi:hypothetical protein D7W79_39705 [Corallococcus exercitus]|nr:hypothetical protein D7W79_39705 [Corallococcus exercitus]